MFYFQQSQSLCRIYKFLLYAVFGLVFLLNVYELVVTLSLPLIIPVIFTLTVMISTYMKHEVAKFVIQLWSIISGIAGLGDLLSQNNMVGGTIMIMTGLFFWFYSDCALKVYPAK